jgi:predicted Zn-dependent protease
MPLRNSNNHSLRAQLDRGIKLHRARKVEEATELLERLAHDFPRSAAVAGYLGSVYFEQDEPATAAKWFRRAIRLSPKSELASLGLFHSLWNSNAAMEAVAEMRRFLRTADSPAYAKLLRDLTVEGRLVPLLAGAA